MKTTDSKDLAKVNQILPIMQEYFGKSMNLARIKLMAYMLHALCVVQTVSLHKLASAMPTSVERDSNLRRIQRFIANYALNLDLVAMMIFSLLPVKNGLVLSMDRTNWKFGGAIPIGKNARISWSGSSDFLDMTASTALWPTASHRQGVDWMA